MPPPRLKRKRRNLSTNETQPHRDAEIARGSEPDRMLPTGYGLSLVGCALFGLGGVIDMFWHLRFGIEVSLQALISPPHLLLMAALGLIVTGPLRAACFYHGKALLPLAMTVVLQNYDGGGPRCRRIMDCDGARVSCVDHVVI